MPSQSRPKDKTKVLLLEGIHSRAAYILHRAGYTQVESLPGAQSRAQLAAAIADVHILGIRSRSQLDAELLSHATKLSAIGCFCIGTNQVDLKHSQNSGIPVFNAPYANTRSVAELALAEAIMLMRGIPQKSMAAHRGEWLKTASNSHEARGKILGIVGYGHIGTQLSILAECLGMQVIYYDIVSRLPLGNARAVQSLDELLAASDIVSLHVPATPQTENMIAADQLATMRPGSYLVNPSRGAVVNIPDLHDALKQEHISGAAIDVFPAEPRTNHDEFISELRGLDQVILTPHIGGSTLEAEESIAQEVAEKLIHYSQNGSTLNAVNFPEVSLPDHREEANRILHIHRNEAGVLQQINHVFSKNDTNILAQYLQTRDQIGYVVMDIAATNTAKLLQQPRDIPATIRCRALH